MRQSPAPPPDPTYAASAASSCRPVEAPGRVPVTFIGGVSTDHSGFGVGRILDVELIADRILALHEDRELPLIPGYERFSYQIQEHQK